MPWATFSSQARYALPSAAPPFENWPQSRCGMLYRTSSASRSAFAAASVKPLASTSGSSGPIHSPTGCRAIFLIRSAFLSLPALV